MSDIRLSPAGVPIDIPADIPSSDSVSIDAGSPVTTVELEADSPTSSIDEGEMLLTMDVWPADGSHELEQADISHVPTAPEDGAGLVIFWV